MSGVTLLLAILLLSETVDFKKTNTDQADESFSIHRLISRRPVVMILATAFAIGSYVASVMSTFSPYAERAIFPVQSPEVVARSAGIAIGVMGLGVAIGQMALVGPLVKRLGNRSWLCLAVRY